MRQPVRCRRTGLWLARYADQDGRIRQAGRSERKRDAQAAIVKAMVNVPGGSEARRCACGTPEVGRWPSASETGSGAW
jgi:hypothetical protein